MKDQHLCCGYELTLATRVIAALGLTISIMLATVLLHDTTSKNYEISRKVAFSLGLDWRHIHKDADISENADPEGKQISIVLITYSSIFFIINVLLLLATILENQILSSVWLVCEFLGCLSKAGALIYHLITELKQINALFIVGSLFYVLIMSWFWLVIFKAQSRWSKKMKPSSVSFEMKSLHNETLESVFLDSPSIYTTGNLYTTI